MQDLWSSGLKFWSKPPEINTATIMYEEVRLYGEKKLALHKTSNMFNHPNLSVHRIFKINYIFCFEGSLKLCILGRSEMPVESCLGFIPVSYK